MTCTHLIACAITPELEQYATELLRGGNTAALGAAMLNGPCRQVK